MTRPARGALTRRWGATLAAMRAVAALSLGLAAGGCQSGKSEAPPPAAARPASGSSRPAASAPAAPAAPAPAHVQLPRSPATPPHRTVRPLGRAQLERLAAAAFPGFAREDHDTYYGSVEVRHVTQTRPRLGVTVTIGPCTRARACPAMDLARWTARRDELARQLPKELVGRPDTRFEIGARALAGAPAIYTYQLGYAAGTDANDQPSIDYSDAYTLYYNDGVNQVRVMAHYLDDAVGGIDQLLALAPPEDLEKLAVAFASFYVHAWN
jgi:hypothetical protein